MTATPSEETLFSEALALSPAERAAYLDRVCIGPPTVLGPAFALAACGGSSLPIGGCGDAVGAGFVSRLSRGPAIPVMDPLPRTSPSAPLALRI